MNHFDVIASLMTIVGLSTPILLAGLGELVAEKSGVLNLGVEGMMLLGAIGGFAGGVMLGDPWLAVVCAALSGAAGAVLFGVFVLLLNANQTASGLALTIFGTGLSSLLGLSFTGRILMPFGSIFPRALSHDHFWQLFFGYSPMVYFALIMVPVLGWFLYSTRAGLILRAVGENDHSAHSLGYSVVGVRFAAIAFGGAMAGIGGAYFSLVITPMWAERMTAGRGWIALALVVFSGWRTGADVDRGLSFRRADVAGTFCQGRRLHRFPACRAGGPLAILGRDALHDDGGGAGHHLVARTGRRQCAGLSWQAIPAFKLNQQPFETKTVQQEKTTWQD